MVRKLISEWQALAGPHLWWSLHAEKSQHRVLPPFSRCYPRLEGKLLTRYSPFCRYPLRDRSTCMPNPRRQRSLWARIKLSERTWLYFFRGLDNKISKIKFYPYFWLFMSATKITNVLMFVKFFFCVFNVLLLGENFSQLSKNQGVTFYLKIAIPPSCVRTQRRKSGLRYSIQGIN